MQLFGSILYYIVFSFVRAVYTIKKSELVAKQKNLLLILFNDELLIDYKK